MSDSPLNPLTAMSNAASAVTTINNALKTYPDKEWNYSRITLIAKPLHSVPGPYVLTCELLKRADKLSQGVIREISAEIQWGERHSSELGILEIISLRLNKALCDTCASAPIHPVIRVQKKSDLGLRDDAPVIWYTVTEISGEDFESR